MCLTCPCVRALVLAEVRRGQLIAATLELELGMVVKPPVDAWSQAWVLCQEQQAFGTTEPSLQPLAFYFFCTKLKNISRAEHGDAHL